MDTDASKKVWVGKLPAACTDADLITHFGQLGSPSSAAIIKPGIG